MKVKIWIIWSVYVAADVQKLMNDHYCTNYLSQELKNIELSMYKHVENIQKKNFFATYFLFNPDF